MPFNCYTCGAVVREVDRCVIQIPDGYSSGSGVGWGYNAGTFSQWLTSTYYKNVSVCSKCYDIEVRAGCWSAVVKVLMLVVIVTALVCYFVYY